MLEVERIIEELVKEFAVDNIEDITSLGDNMYKVEGGTYLVLLESKADELVDSLISTRLADLMDAEELAGQLGYSTHTMQMIKSNITEDNKLIKELADAQGITNQLVKLIRKDYYDRGNFLATYDGHEHERYLGDTEDYLYIYRTA